VRLLWEQEVVGSNPTTPTMYKQEDNMKKWIKLSSNHDVAMIKSQIDYLISEKKLVSYTATTSTTGKNSKQYDLTHIIDNWSPLINNLRLQAGQLLSDKGLMTINDTLDLLSVWTVLGYEDSFHKVHLHSKEEDLISTVSYLAVNEYDENKPGSFFAIIDDQVYLKNPKVGDMIIIPSNVLHGTFPQGKGLRQTFNADFKISRNVPFN